MGENLCSMAEVGDYIIGLNGCVRGTTLHEGQKKEKKGKKGNLNHGETAKNIILHLLPSLCYIYSNDMWGNCVTD